MAEKEVKSAEAISREGFIKKVSDIQSRMHVGKDENNTFGGFKYKKNEQIISAVKPMLKEHGLIYQQSVEMVMIGDRYYAKATSLLTDGSNQITNTAYAREPLLKKGMDESQVTGTASTYAKKQGSDDMFLAGAESVDPDDLDGETITTSQSPPPPAPKKEAPKKEQKPEDSAVPGPSPKTNKTPEDLVEVVTKRIKHEVMVALDKKEIKDTNTTGYTIERFKYHKAKIDAKYGADFMNQLHWQTILNGIGAELKGGEE